MTNPHLLTSVNLLSLTALLPLEIPIQEVRGGGHCLQPMGERQKIVDLVREDQLSELDALFS
jgi:hypothetical protein